MPMSFHRLLEIASSAFEYCRDCDISKFLAGQKTKNDVRPFTPSNNGPDDHFLALLAIPAESDRLRIANQERRKQQLDEFSEGKCDPRMNLVEMANQALAAAAAEGISFPWEDTGKKPQSPPSQGQRKLPELQDSDLALMAEHYIHFAPQMGLSLPGDMVDADLGQESHVGCVEQDGQDRQNTSCQ
eukprot:TRINITY_DN80370_c0_g1_i1.p1 TRINITY_DN80370_c0_g1~~TRINITY_DN80370_c0_g1_i1.p1  ORF type:complete len:186 (-),score=31.80 TRINITY_DN80370_c0_g1_i1:42-599(-)